jgi:hypothetical protein
MNEPLNSFEIRDAAINADQIRQIITKKIEQRRQHAQNHSIDFVQLARPVKLVEEAKHWAFDIMEHNKAALLIQPYTVPPKQGLLTHILLWLKKQAHNLVIYYVNLSGKKQISFNESVAEVIAIYQAEIESLQEKVTYLESQVQRMESQNPIKEAQKYE